MDASTAFGTRTGLANVACANVSSDIAAIFVVNTFEAAVLSREETEIETIVGVSTSTQTDFNGVGNISSQIRGSVLDLGATDIVIGSTS